MHEHFESTSLAKKALYKYSSFPFSFYVPLTGRRTTESVMYGKCSTRPPVVNFLAKVVSDIAIFVLKRDVKLQLTPG